MNWFNIYGLIILVILLLPNILYAITVKDGFINKFNNKPLEVFEIIGRVGSFVFLFINLPFTYYGFWFKNALTIYIIINGILILLYCSTWVVLWKKNNLLRAIVLSSLPSILFIFSGIMILSIPLIVSSIIFAMTHITISVINAVR